MTKEETNTELKAIIRRSDLWSPTDSPKTVAALMVIAVLRFLGIPHEQAQKVMLRALASLKPKRHSSGRIRAANNALLPHGAEQLDPVVPHAVHVRAHRQCLESGVSRRSEQGLRIAFSSPSHTGQSPGSSTTGMRS